MRYRIRKIMRRKMISLTLVLIFISGIVAWIRPTFTPAIAGEASIASLEKIELGNMEQWILVRGQNTTNPVLLWLHGGPGAAQMPVARYFNSALEEHFIVVHWDQRGAGKSNPSNFDESTMTFDQYLSDAHELTLYLKSRFGQDKIYLVGHSWGSQLGIRLAQIYPQDYYAYIGVGQVVNFRRAQEIGYDWLLHQVKDKSSLSKLKSLGRPPFTDHVEFVRYIKLVDAFGGGFDVGFARLAWITLCAPEYNLRDVTAWLRGSNRGSGPMWYTSIYQSFDAMKEISRLELPVYFFVGIHDYNTPMTLVKNYYKSLNALKGKELVIFESSAHTPFMGEAEKFNQGLIRVLSETYKPLNMDKEKH